MAEVVGAELELEAVGGGALRAGHDPGVADQDVDGPAVGKVARREGPHAGQRREVQLPQLEVGPRHGLEDPPRAASPLGRSRTAMVTEAPWAANARVVSTPRPADAPVTRTWVPSGRSRRGPRRWWWSSRSSWPGCWHGSYKAMAAVPVEVIVTLPLTLLARTVRRRAAGAGGRRLAFEIGAGAAHDAGDVEPHERAPPHPDLDAARGRAAARPCPGGPRPRPPARRPSSRPRRRRPTRMVSDPDAEPGLAVVADAVDPQRSPTRSGSRGVRRPCRPVPSRWPSRARPASSTCSRRSSRSPC